MTDEQEPPKRRKRRMWTIFVVTFHVLGLLSAIDAIMSAAGWCLCEIA